MIENIAFSKAFIFVVLTLTIESVFKCLCSVKKVCGFEEKLRLDRISVDNRIIWTGPEIRGKQNSLVSRGATDKAPSNPDKLKTTFFSCLAKRLHKKGLIDH